MHSYYKYILLTIILSTTAATAQNPYSEAGTAGNVMLRIGVAPRAEALSGAFAAIADDENALFYNPAGLGNFYRGIVSLNHIEWFQDIRIDNLTGAYPITARTGLAAAITHMWMPDIQGMDASGNPTWPFQVNNSIITIGTGYKLTSVISVGFNLKYFQENLSSYSSSGLATSVGVLLRNFYDTFSAAVTIDNLGGEIKYDRNSQRLPKTYRWGFAYKIGFPDLWLALDAVKSIDTPLNFNLGVEYEYWHQFAIRAGNKFVAGELFNPAFGVGINIQQKYYINYTFINYPDLGGTHRIGFSFHFSTPTGRFGTVTASQLPKEIKVAIPPSAVTAEIKGEELIIRWDEVRGASYNVYARHTPSNTDWTRLNKNPLSLTEIRYKKPTVSGKYFFRVSSIINNKESSYSNVVTLDVK